MHPRILLRTHYQADEPRLIIAAVTHCTSATASKDEDAVAEKVKRWAHAHGRILSIPGATYAVGNARSLGLLNNSNRWTATGLAFGYLHNASASAESAAIFTLAAPEQRLYLKQYMVNAGALVISFGRWLLAHGSTTDDELRDSSIIEERVREVLDEYLSLATDIRDRTVIRRERERLQRSRYAASTKRHKRYQLLKTLQRLRLLRVTKVAGEDERIGPDAEGRLAALVASIPDAGALEAVIRNGSLKAVLDTSLREAQRSDLPLLSPTHLIAATYDYAMRLGLQACPLAYLDDVFYGVFPVDAEGTAHSTPEEVLQTVRAEAPADVRFHVDRRGRRAFVLIGDAALRRLTKDLVSPDRGGRLS
jgi:hypothetical protein